jgi:hypothetical protein
MRDTNTKRAPQLIIEGDTAATHLRYDDPAEAMRLVLRAYRRRRDAGRSLSTDAQYGGRGALLRAAACYMFAWNRVYVNAMWPWAPKTWQPKDDVENLVMAAALLLAALTIAIKQRGGAS